MIAYPDATETSPLLATHPLRYLGEFENEAAITQEREALDDVNEDALSSVAQDDDDEGLPEVKKKLPLIMPALAVGIFLAACDGTVVASSYSRIGSDLNALNRTSWLATAYLMTLTCFQPLYGKLSDIFGRKPVLLFSYVAFAVGCLTCGLAKDMPTMIAGRALSGVGGASNAIVSIVLTDIVPLRERGTWSAFTNLIFAAGASAGAPIGGLVADTIGWRWSFLGQIPLCVLAFGAVSLTLQLPQKRPSSLREKTQRIDFFGATTLFAALFMLILGQDLGSNGSWSAPGTIAVNLLFQPLVAIFLLVERKYAVDPLVPPRLLLDRRLVIVNLTIFFSLAAWYGIIFYTPLFLQVANGLGAFDAGLRLLPGIISAVAGSLIAGTVIRKTGRFYWVNVASVASMLLGCTLIVANIGIVHAAPSGLFLGMIIGGIGNGGSLTSNTIAALAQASKADQAVVTSMGFLFRSLGTTLGLSVLSTMMQQTLRWQLRVQLGNGHNVEDIVRNVRRSLDYLDDLTPELRFVVRQAYGASIAVAFAGVLCLMAIALAFSFFACEVSLERKTSRGAQRDTRRDSVVEDVAQ